MPLIVPIAGGGFYSVIRVSASLATLELTGENIPVSSLSSLLARGERLDQALALESIRGETGASAAGLLDAGVARETGALGASDAGAFDTRASLSALEANGETISAARLSLDVGASGEGGRQRLYDVLGSIAASRVMQDTALSLLLIQGLLTQASRATLTRETNALHTALITFEIGAQGEEVSRASLTTGRVSVNEAPASLEVQRATGIDIIIDVLDDIVSSIRGDIC